MKITVRLAVLVAIASIGLIGPSLAQQAPKSRHHAQVAPVPATPPSGATPAPPPASPGWAAHCNSVSRDAPLECAIEQNAVLTKTGQVVVVVAFRVAGDTRAPVAFVQLPLGLNLQTGTKLQVDDGKAIDLPIQTCENRGCYASNAVTPELLTALKSGKQLNVSFQNLAKETITVESTTGAVAVGREELPLSGGFRPMPVPHF
ncbi:MAG: invasion associated locus B family protein, partial [Bradyrhizobium sp.]